MPFRFRKLQIPDVLLIESRAFDDERGYLVETFKLSEFVENGIHSIFVQDNFTHSRGNVLRGLHYQKEPQAQGKLVGVAVGEIFDVAVDLRRGSPTYGQWVGEQLKDGCRQLMWIPEGFAHGFCVLSGAADVVYKVTREYAPELERGIRWDDPALAIGWPVERPLLSKKDASLPFMDGADINFNY
jgi:dTDP-4-dehydrorhamnose 3,5-epimerase